MAEKIKEEIGAVKCYLALLAFHEAVCGNKKVFKKNRQFKRWLASSMLLKNDTKVVGPRDSKRIFWLLSIVNGFIKRDGKVIVITKSGIDFLWADEFKRFEIFKNIKEDQSFLKRPRYKGMSSARKVSESVNIKTLREVVLLDGQIEHVGKGYKLIKYSHLSKKSNQAGFIRLILKLALSDDCNSVSFAEIDAWLKGELHEHSKTQEVFFFVGGRGYMEIGDDKVPVKKGWLVIIDAGIPHRIVPEIVPFEGQQLYGLVASFPGWDGPDDYVIGKSKAINDGPSD